MNKDVLSYLCTNKKTGNMTRKTGIITSIASTVFIGTCFLLAFSARTTIHEKTGNMVGFKVSGGVSSTADAVKYYTLVKEILGEAWLNNDYFRIGTSRAANYILSDILGSETKYF